jgi:hypothetical protein
MVLYLDFRNESQVIGLIGEESADWLENAGRRLEFTALAEADRRFGLAKDRPQTVVAAVWPNGGADVSWSTARTAVAVANALAFAWGVPAVGLEVEGLGRVELAAAIRSAAKDAGADARLSVSYSGDPNITAPKSDF